MVSAIDINDFVAADQDDSTEVTRLNKIIEEKNANIYKLMTLLEKQIYKNKIQSKQVNEADERFAFFNDIFEKLTKEIEELKKS